MIKSAQSIGRCIIMKSNKTDETYSSIRDEWKNVNWDLIQRMRFMNADAEIDPEDGYELKKDNDE